MASNGVIAHRFANRDYNKEKGLKGNSTSISGNNYYSYSTVFGQWVDEKVCIVYWGSTSVTSYKHMLRCSDFPKDITIFPYDDGGGRSAYSYSSWHGCDLLGWRGEFNYDARVRLIDYWVREIYDALHAIVNGKGKDLDKRAERAIEEYWEYIEELCSMYKDTSVGKWLREQHLREDKKVLAQKRKMVKLIADGERSVEAITDAMFGEGTFNKYWDYCARFRKAEDNKAKMTWLCHRLGLVSPYQSEWCSDYINKDMSASDVRKLSAKERNELHFSNLMRIEWNKKASERDKKFEKNKWNAYKWIVGYEAQKEKRWNGYYAKTDINKCRNMFNGEVYEVNDDGIYGFAWCTTSVDFDYNAFRKSEDKEQWIRSFYGDVKKAQDNVRAIRILKRVEAHIKEKERSWDDDVYLNDEWLRERTTDEEYALVSWFIERQDKYFADKEARKRAEAIERQRIEEERKREEEYQKQVKQEQIDACIARGAEGCRDLWRLHLDDIYEAHHEFDKVELTGCPEKYKDFFFGGNVLLRLNLDKTYVESSKNVRVPVAVARLWFKKVKQWHEDEKSFKPMEWNTKGNGTYTVSEYKNDILTAGCHDIAYAEMERMYNQIIAETA